MQIILLFVRVTLNCHVYRMGDIYLLAFCSSLVAPRPKRLVLRTDTSVRPYGWVLSFRVIAMADRCVCPLLYAGEFLFYFFILFFAG